MTAAGALRRRGVSREALRALTHRRCYLAFALLLAVERPLTLLLGQPVPHHVADVVEDDCVGLPLGSPQHSAHLLEVEPFGLRGAQQDGCGYHRDVGTFADDFAGR